MNSPEVQKAAIDALEELSEMPEEKVHRLLDELEEGPWCAFIKDMQENMKDLDPEYSKLVDDHFWELI